MNDERWTSLFTQLLGFHDSREDAESYVGRQPVHPAPRIGEAGLATGFSGQLAAL